MRIQVSRDFTETRAVIKVIGVGGAGGNAINRMAEAGVRGVELIAANTDTQDLQRILAEVKIQVGSEGLGAGGDPARGRAAMVETEEQVREYLQGAHLVFVTAGMGGGTGTGGAPIVAHLAKEMGALTIGVVTRPFDFEKLNRATLADQGIQEMRQNVDTLLVIPNQKLLEIIDHDTTAEAAFKIADDVLLRSITSISDVITKSGQINMDLNDLRAIMKGAGDALIGMGEASGPGRALKAAKAAVQSRLLENGGMEGAKGLIINITGAKSGASSLKLSEIEEATAFITVNANPDAKTKPGYAYDDSLGDAIRITVIATGFPMRRRSLARAGYKPGPAAAVAKHPLDVEPLIRRAASSPEDWSKPAYLRLKVRRLK